MTHTQLFTQLADIESNFSMAAQYFSQKLENHATEQHKSLEHCALKQNDYVSSCGIPLMPVCIKLRDLGGATAATRVVTAGGAKCSQ